MFLKFASFFSTSFQNSTKKPPWPNPSARRIGYGIKTTNMRRLGVDAPCGVLDPKETVLLDVSRDAFAFGQESTNNDRLTVEWTNNPDEAAKQFRREGCQGDGMIRRKNSQLSTTHLFNKSVYFPLVFFFLSNKNSFT
ncbi:Major sperm protein [Caenorhabditis elegans]|uniref:Major sperm protein n=1 Tax=Caenorhabditis elegans TaxID=6239 RepID=Q9NAF5_CAEEL|nr:Major sperm protein [Caenorhabditis elegans]CAB55045.2 Major sperm protein [Caenorhabditis elegans]|eukprot:NP_506636.2 Major sperm protein [Caenorhabditis elegans]